MARVIAGTLGRAVRTVVAAMTAVVLAGAPVAAAPNLKNGKLTEGAGGVPMHWRTEAWQRELSRFAWEVGTDGAGTISITNLQPNDARWCQTVAVHPGAIYQVSARVKTLDIGAETAGAMIAVEPRIVDTRDVRGTQDWQRVEVTAQAKDEASWDICARLGSYSNLNTGTAWFTDLVLTEVRSSVVSRPWWPGLRAALSQGWTPAVLALAGGLLLAFGFGIIGGPRT